MRVFIFACIAMIGIAIVSALGFSCLSEPVSKANSTDNVRLGG